MELLHGEITGKIIGAAYEVYKELGYGFLEKVYKKAMHVELSAINVKCEEEPFLPLHYKGVHLTDYYGIFSWRMW